MKVKSESEVAQSCPTLSDPMTAAHQAPLSLDFPGKSTGEGWIRGTGSKIYTTVHKIDKQQGFTAWYLELLEKAMAPHSSNLACKIPWTEEPGGLQSMGS